ncbi:MAG TPA: TIGR01777 family oxidoreductase [Bacteroidales bacterium]|nr:TIGR01777 family oxidoreductase [Bacteroidales bacterium]
MKAVLTGSGGFVGSALKPMLLGMGYEVLTPEREILYGPPEKLVPLMESAKVIVHLAGAPIAARWTKRYMNEIYQSRIITTTNIAKAVSLADAKPELFISSSAVGIYPDHGLHDDYTGEAADGFLAKVCLDWEKASWEVPGGVRVVNLRFGLILGSEGGALPKMVLPFRFFAGTRFGSGKQWVSWVHLHDVLEIVRFAIQNPELNGPVNVVSPNPLHHDEFIRAISAVTGRPAWMQVPEFALKWLLGDGAAVLTRGQAAVPQKLTDAQYRFLYPDLNDALNHLLRKPN